MIVQSRLLKLRVKLPLKIVDSLYDGPEQIRKVQKVCTYNNQEILTFAEGQDHNLLTQGVNID